MGTKKVSTRSAPVFRLPYLKLMRALAYANRSYASTWEFLNSLYLATPPAPEDKDKSFQNQYDQWIAEGRQLRRTGRMTPSMINKLQIDPWYTWYINNGCPEQFGDKTSRVCALVAESVNLRLRRAVDIALYLGESPEEIEKKLERYEFAPRWSSSEIQIYWQFIWDVEEMRAVDWEYYVKRMDFINPMLPHVKMLGNRTRQELLTFAYGSDMLDPQVALKQIMDSQHQIYFKTLERMESGAIDYNQTVLDRIAASFAMMTTRYDPSKIVSPGGSGESRDKLPPRFRVILTDKERIQEGLTPAQYNAGERPITTKDLDGLYATAYDDASMNRLLTEDYEQET